MPELAFADERKYVADRLRYIAGEHDQQTVIDVLMQKNPHSVEDDGRGGYVRAVGDFAVDWQKSELDRLRRHVKGFVADRLLSVFPGLTTGAGK